MAEIPEWYEISRDSRKKYLNTFIIIIIFLYIVNTFTCAFVYRPKNTIFYFSSTAIKKLLPICGNKKYILSFYNIESHRLVADEIYFKNHIVKFLLFDYSEYYPLL